MKTVATFTRTADDDDVAAADVDILSGAEETTSGVFAAAVVWGVSFYENKPPLKWVTKEASWWLWWWWPHQYTDTTG